MSDAHAVELIAIFDGAVIAVRHLVVPIPITLGAAPGSWLPLPEGVGDFTLLRPCASGWELQIPREREIHSLVLADGDRFSVELGALTVLVSTTTAPERMPVPLVVDRTLLASLAGCALAAAALLLILFSIPPMPARLGIGPGGQLRLARFILAPVISRPGGGSGPPSTGAAPRRIRTRPVGRKPSRADVEKAASGAGVLGILRAFEGTQVASVFARESALGVESETALEALDGAAAPDAFGAGGIGVIVANGGDGGDGPGGSGNGSTIGVGSLGTVRAFGAAGGGSGYGRGAGGTCWGRLPCRHPGAPDVEGGTATVRGSLDKEIIRRVVRKHMNEIRFCYEKQLAHREDLRGRLSARFVIATSGLVVASTVENSSVDDSEVGRCVAAAIRRWEFPWRGSGVAVVSYPFVFQPADE